MFKEISDFFNIGLLIAVEALDMASTTGVPGNLGPFFLFIKFLRLMVRYEFIIF